MYGFDYKIIERYPKYRFYENGMIYSIHRNFWKQMIGCVGKNGYRYGTFINVLGFYEKDYYHRLICEAWHGPCPITGEKMECRHFPDQNKLNNNKDNLKWGTIHENANDRIVGGTQLHGEDVYHSTMSNVDREKAFEMIDCGFPVKIISERFDVHKRIIDGMKQGLVRRPNGCSS